jgi:hypothetical protein
MVVLKIVLSAVMVSAALAFYCACALSSQISREEEAAEAAQ